MLVTDRGGVFEYLTRVRVQLEDYARFLFRVRNVDELSKIEASFGYLVQM